MLTELSAASLAAADSLEGFGRGGQRGDRAAFMARVVQMNDLLTNRDRLPLPEMRYRLYQAMSTSDFPYVTGAVLERRLLGEFDDYPETIERLFRRTTRLNFNLNDAIRVDGGDGRLEEVAEGGEYTMTQLVEDKWQYRLKVYGRKAALSWQAMVNDDLGAFNSIPSRFGRGARRTRQFLMTSLFMGANGWRSTLFDSSGGQTAVATTALDPTNLAAAIKAFAEYTIHGEPIVSRPKYLYVCPALEQKAVELVNEPALLALVTGLASTSGKSTERVSLSNEYIRRTRLEVVVDPWAPYVATSGTLGSTVWGLFAEPNDTPAGEIGVLMGHETPVIVTRAPNAVRIGGGFDVGSFETDGVEYKVRDVFGGVAMYPQARWLSNGQGG